MQDPSVTTAEAYESLFVPLMGVRLADATVEAILAEAEVALARHVVADGSMRFEVAAHIATAQSPAERTPAR